MNESNEARPVVIETMGLETAGPALHRHRRGSWLALVLGLALVAGACGDAPPEEAAPAEEAIRQEPVDPEGATLVYTGFMTPESVLHDTEADVYLVSNINGDPLEKTGNGFISRLAPDGEIRALRWIDGEAEGVTLHAPKGMALVGERLYVTDIDVVRVFDRQTGDPLEELPVEGATFLNDLAAGPDGTVYVSDTGMGPGFQPSGTDAVYALRNGSWEPLVRGAELLHPNGLVVDGSDVLMVPFGGNVIFRIPAAGGAASEVTTLPAGQLDGIVRLDDGTLLVSSWEGSAVYRVSPDGEIDAVVSGVQAPADIGWDAQRSRLLIPHFMGDRVEARRIP